MESQDCRICGAAFRVNVLKDGKCEKCDKEHPLASSRRELVDKNVMQEKENIGHIHNVVDKRIRAILLELKIAGECRCGAMFNKTGPNRKYCEPCSAQRANLPHKKRTDTIKETENVG
jgi:hypothetical protein